MVMNHQGDWSMIQKKGARYTNTGTTAKIGTTGDTGAVIRISKDFAYIRLDQPSQEHHRNTTGTPQEHHRNTTGTHAPRENLRISRKSNQTRVGMSHMHSYKISMHVQSYT